MKNIICGVLTKKKKFYFSFDDDKKMLTIQPVKMNLFPAPFPDMEFEDYPYLKERMDIEGETNTGTYIRFIDIKFSSIGRGCFQAWVPAYIIGKNTFYPVAKPYIIKEIEFKGECIDRFMSSKCTATNKWDTKKNKLQINVNYGKDKIKKFKYDNLDFSFIPGWVMTSVHKDVKNLLTMQTSLCVESERAMNIKNIINVYRDVQKLLSFVCYRKHVDFDSIVLKQMMPIRTGDVVEDRTVEFELCVTSDDEEKYDLPKVGKNMILKDYIENIALLMQGIKENEYMLLSFPVNSLKVNIIDSSKYISISAAFESEFDILYPKFKSTRKKNYNEAKIATLKYLKNQKNNKKYNYKTREYFGDLLEFVDECEGRLEEQITHVLKSYSYIVEPEREYFQKQYPSISFDNRSLAKAFADKRNNLSHGSKLEKFKALEIASYSIIRKINYAMVLEQAKFSVEDIKEIIEQVL